MRATMLPMLLAALAGAPLADAAETTGPAPRTQTIVLIRHGEKPAAGLGQLDCQGLNRALALPPIIAAQFGRPMAIFAPNPAAMKPDGKGGDYYYVRPLATIEPTAIALGMPVNLGIGYSDIKLLQAALLTRTFHTGTVLVAWEHKQIVDLAKALMAAFHGDARLVPAWQYDDFDSIYILRIDWGATPPRIAFSRAQEGLNNLGTACPAGQ